MGLSVTPSQSLVYVPKHELLKDLHCDKVRPAIAYGRGQRKRYGLHCGLHSVALHLQRCGLASCMAKRSHWSGVAISLRLGSRLGWTHMACCVCIVGEQTDSSLPLLNDGTHSHKDCFFVSLQYPSLQASLLKLVRAHVGRGHGQRPQHQKATRTGRVKRQASASSQKRPHIK